MINYQDPAILQGQATLDQAREQAGFNHLLPKKQTKLSDITASQHAEASRYMKLASNFSRVRNLDSSTSLRANASSSTLNKPSALNKPREAAPPAAPGLGDGVRIYPLVMLAAIRSKQDVAARLWFIARGLDDPRGSGWIYKQNLWDFLKTRGVNERTRRRWLDAALKIGLIVEEINHLNGQPVYRIASLRAGSKILGVNDARGYPALIPARYLLKRSWHPYAWAGYLATRSGAPISQVKLAEITGLSARTQKKYQRLVPVKKTRNYCQTNLDHTHLTGVREHGRPSAFVGYKGKINYRLPDAIEVPQELAKRPEKPKTVKAENGIKPGSKFSHILGREKRQDAIKMFCKTEEAAAAALRKIARIDSTNRPREVYYPGFRGRTCQFWYAKEVESTAGLC